MKRNRFLPLCYSNKNSYVYVVGVSGGPDSMFLVEKMRILGYKFVVAHVNYRKRFDSDFDEKIVREYCQRYCIKFFVRHLSNSEFCGGNFQNFARKFRYDFFFQIANEVSAKGIVIAHNFEDHLETYKLQVERDSFVNFWGLSFKYFQNCYYLIRPILSFSKSFIIKYLVDANLKYAVDYTNDLNIYRRNIIRKEIFSLSEEEKLKIYYEILRKNKDLKARISNLKEIISKIIKNNSLILNDFWFNSEYETQERVIYYWVNNFTTGEFFQRKKKIFSEAVKQLNSSKPNINFKLSNNIIIKKVRSLAFIHCN